MPDPTLLAPVPQNTEPIDGLTSRMEGNWLRWFRDLKLRVEAMPAESLAAANAFATAAIAVAVAALEAYTTAAVAASAAAVRAEDVEVEVEANYAGTTIGLQLSRAYRITLNTSTTLELAGATNAGPFLLTLVQGGAGSHTCAIAGALYPGGVAPVLSTASGAIDRLIVTKSGADYLVSAELDFS